MRYLVLLMLALASACAPEPEASEDPPAPIETVAQKDESEPAADESDEACKRLTFEDVLLTHCVAEPERHTIHTVLTGKDGKPYRGLGRYAEMRASQLPDSEPHKVVFAMNGGMFNDAGQPIGYYVEDGERMQTLNRKEATGNFHLLPNGVFYGTDGEWEVRSSDWFADNVTERPQFGTQSGPMLVIDGKLHPKIADDGESQYIRNAVGIDEDGRAHFVISEMPLSFGKLARFYRDELEVPNALYLDGNVSALWYPKAARIDASPPLGPLIVVEKRAMAKPAGEESDPDEPADAAEEAAEKKTKAS